MSQLVKGKIFREYIGSKSAMENSGGFPVEIINGEISEFHFILAYAKEDYDPTTNKGNGNFRPTWNVKFDVESIKKLKKDNKNVKVAISIGGRGSHSPAFDPVGKYRWIEKAKKSLKQIIFEDYKSDHCGCSGTVIDGIDIAYERIESDADEFAYCMGEVIKDLKSNGLVISIAPSKPFESHYRKLYEDNTSDICWVNYQFYYEKLSTAEEFKNRYNNEVDCFTVEKLLAGFSTDPNDNDNISPQDFFDACRQLIGTGSLPGIFVCDADDSIHYDPRFFVEKQAQLIILKKESKSHSHA